jgi:hypothetical protein
VLLLALLPLLLKWQERQQAGCGSASCCNPAAISLLPDCDSAVLTEA